MTIALAAIGLLLVPLGVGAWVAWRRRRVKAAWLDLPDTTLAYEPVARLNVERLSRAARLAITNLAAVWPLAGIEIALVGWCVRIQPTDTWLLGDREVGGQLLTENGQPYILVGPDLSALCHEIAHAMERVLDRKPDPTHSRWEERGITSADNQFRNGLALL